MKIKNLVLATVILGAQAAGYPLAADEASDQIKALQKQIEALTQRVLYLEQHQAQPAGDTSTRPQTLAPSTSDGKAEPLAQPARIPDPKPEPDQAAAVEKARPAPRVSLDTGGFAVTSADTNFVLRIRGVLQADTRTFFKDNPASVGNDGFLLRRARPMIEGTVFRDFDFLFVPDFGGTGAPSIFDAYVNYRYQPELQLRVGKFRPPVGLEQAMADRNLLFNERSLVTDLVPNRDVGVELWGDISEGVASYAVGLFNGAGDARNPPNAAFDDNKAVAARIFFHPFKKAGAPALEGFGFGLAGSYKSVGTNATGLPNNSGFTTDGQQQFFVYANGVVANGEHWRLSPQTTYTYGPFGLMGEYAISDQRVAHGAKAQRLENSAWQVSVQWVLTGEDASFTGLTPRRPFDPRHGGWGALQLLARYAELEVDRAAFPTFADPAAAARSAAAWSVGLDWWLNANMRVMTSFSHTTFDGGGTGASAVGLVTHQPENVVFTRVQIAF